MGTSAHARAWRWARDAVHGFTGILTGSSSSPSGRWRLQRTRRSETEWERRGEHVECFRFDDGYVTTVEYDTRAVTWQLTPGPVTLGSALAAAALYIQHDVTPQLDRSGRMFIAVDDDMTPVQVFEEIADRPVEYVFLDGVRTVDEFPPFLEGTADFERVFERMAPVEPRPLWD